MFYSPLILLVMVVFFLHLREEIADLGAPVASIGGAGTFDAIFLSGIIAVLLSY